MRQFIIAILLLASSAFAQNEPDVKPLPKPKATEKSFVPILDKPPIPAKLPTLGNLTAEQKAEIVKLLTNAKGVEAPNIFKEADENILPMPPEAVYKQVIADLQTVPLEEQQFTRYLSLYAIEPKDRREHMLVTSFVLNSLSWSHKIVWPTVVPNSNNSLLRFNVIDYSRGHISNDVKRWLETWEFMSSADTYFLEPWVIKDDALAAQQLSGSIGCVLRADWFNFYAMLDDDPKTKEAVEGFYSRFLGLPETEAEFLNLLSVDLEDIARRGSDRAGIVVISGEGTDGTKVARNNRKVNRTPTILTPYGGYFYYTQDVINSQGKRNFLNDPLSTFKDGGEYIWRLPNGLQGYYLTARREVKDAKGNVIQVVFDRVSEVPINVAVDPHFEDARVKIRSCVYCHQNGLNKFTDRYSQLIAPVAPGGLVKPVVQDAALIVRAEQLFYPDKEAILIADQMHYTMGVRLATGLTTVEFREMYKKCLDFYDSPVTPQRAIWEFGITDKDIETYLADKVVSTTRGSLLSIVKGFSIQRDTFEEEYKNGKLLQEIKRNIVPKNGQGQINLVVPSTVVGTANASGLRITERPGSITIRKATGLLTPGESTVLATIPADTTLTVIRTTSNGGVNYVYVKYKNNEGWIKLDD